MAELALIHILKVVVVMARLQLALTKMPESVEKSISDSIAETESFLSDYIDEKSRAPITIPYNISKKIVH